jgi:hypothetical protein
LSLPKASVAALDLNEGERVYALLQGDKLKLFDNQINAYGYFANMKLEAVGLK